jgi:hypothetical protein
MLALKVRGWTAAVVITGLLLAKPSVLESGGVRLSAHTAQALRGDLTQQRYQIHTKRLHDYYSSLLSALKAGARADLLSIVEPPENVQYGYQILPKILEIEPPREQRARIVAYSWPWTDKLIADAIREIEQSTAMLARIPELTQTARWRMYETLAHRYLQFCNQMQNIDAHIQYNRLWQTTIADHRAIYDRETALYSLVIERETIRQLLGWLGNRSNKSLRQYTWLHALRNMVENHVRNREMLLARKIDAATVGIDAPEFIHLERRPGLWIFHVPFHTDIEDHDLLISLKEKIETVWRLRTLENEFRVQLDFTLISPDRLYIHRVIPKPSSKIDLDHHLSLFPRNGAILTTGALTTHVFGRAIILGPQAISGRILAHEMGHILGFRDNYVRGYKDLGKDGFQIMEVVAEPDDIMGSGDKGAVFAYHFEKIRDRLQTN